MISISLHIGPITLQFFYGIHPETLYSNQRINAEGENTTRNSLKTRLSDGGRVSFLRMRKFTVCTGSVIEDVTEWEGATLPLKARKTVPGRRLMGQKPHFA